MLVFPRNKQLPVDVRDLSEDQRRRLLALGLEIVRRRMSPLRLYEPMPHQLAFHKSQAPERLIFGGNRTGKTLALCTEIAWDLTATHPYYKGPERDGVMFIVGKDSKHIAQTLWPYLYKRKPTFRMIRDLETGLWRSYRQYDPADLARQAESVPMLPLIDRRLIKDVAWEKKAAGNPEMVRMHNGWVAYCLSSLGAPPRGADIDRCLAGWSEIYDPVAKRFRRIDEIAGPWHVWSFNERTRRAEIRVASQPFVKGFGEITGVSLSNGEVLYTTRKHRLLTTVGWRSVQEAWLGRLPLVEAECRVPSESRIQLRLTRQTSRPAVLVSAGRAVAEANQCPTDETRFSRVASPASRHACSLSSPLTIENVESAGQHAIWDISVPETNNYVYGNSVNHNCFFDEELVHRAWYPEVSARLIDRNGRFVWAATPQTGTDQLYELFLRCISEHGKEKPLCESFFAVPLDNVHISEENKRRFLAKLADNPEQIKVRWDGQFLVPSYRMYPNFSPGVTHGCDFFDIPDNWTRYVSIDPGNQVACAGFFAVPPEGAMKPAHAEDPLRREEPAGKCVYMYDEVYQRDTNVFEFAEAMKHKMDGQNFQAFLIDDHGSRKTESSGKTIYQQYADEFAKRGLKSAATGSAFVSMNVGNESLEAGCEQVRAWLRSRDGEKPRLQILNGTCHGIINDMTRYHRKKTASGDVTDKPDATRFSHGADVVRYAAMHGMPYVKPPLLSRMTGWAMDYLRSKRQMENTKTLESATAEKYVHCGSGP